MSVSRPGEWLRVDLHVHTRFSRDSLTPLEKIIAACRRRGLDKVAITDHNTIAGALALQEMAPELVIVGEEIKTTRGELIAYFLHEEIPKGLEPKEVIARVREQGGVVGVSHPLDRLRREAMGREDVLRIIEQVDFLEVSNARVIFPADNRRAMELAREHGLPGTAGSDAHTVWEIGRAYMEMPAFTTPAEFLAALREARIGGGLSSPLIHFFSTWAKIRCRIGIHSA